MPFCPCIPSQVVKTHEELAAVLLNGEWGRKRYVYVAPAKDFLKFEAFHKLPPPLEDAIDAVAAKSHVRFSVLADYEFPHSFDVYYSPAAPRMEEMSEDQWAKVPDAIATDIPQRETATLVDQDCVHAIDVAKSYIALVHRLSAAGIDPPSGRAKAACRDDIFTLATVATGVRNFQFLDMYRQFRAGVPPYFRVYLETPDSSEPEVYTVQHILERARVERKALFAALRAKRDSFTEYDKVWDDLRACYRSTCETCGALDKKVSYCAKCKAVGYCSKECQAQAWP